MSLNWVIIGSGNGLSLGRYLNQCWLISNSTPGNKLQWNLNKNSNIFSQENSFYNVCKLNTHAQSIWPKLKWWIGYWLWTPLYSCINNLSWYKTNIWSSTTCCLDLINPSHGIKFLKFSWLITAKQLHIMIWYRVCHCCIQVGTNHIGILQF